MVSPSDDVGGCDGSGRWEDSSRWADIPRSLSWAPSSRLSSSRAITPGSSCWPMNEGSASVFVASDAICGPGSGCENGLQPPVQKQYPLGTAKMLAISMMSGARSLWRRDFIVGGGG